MTTRAGILGPSQHCFLKLDPPGDCISSFLLVYSGLVILPVLCSFPDLPQFLQILIPSKLLGVLGKFGLSTCLQILLPDWIICSLGISFGQSLLPNRISSLSLWLICPLGISFGQSLLPLGIVCPLGISFGQSLLPSWISSLSLGI